MAKQSAFQIFNQKLKEKIGVAEQVTTYPEEPELSTKLEVMTNQIKKITREIHKQEKTTSTLLEAGAELSDSLVDGGVSFREDPLRYMLAGSLDKVAEVQRHVDDLRSKLGKQIVSEVYEPLDNVIEVDVKEAKMQKSKFEKARVELDAGISKLNGLGKKAKEEKIKEVELEVEELRKNFSQVGMETVDKLQDTIALSEAEMLGSLVHYMELYRDFFVNSNRFMVTLIPEIEEYKNYIELQREQLHGSSIAKQIEAAAAAAPPEKKFGTLRLKNIKSSFGIGDKKKSDKGTPASEVNIAKPENDPFGKDIEQVANKDGSDVPAIVDKAVEYIENKGLEEEGIFRISASKKEVDKLKGEIAETADETTSSPEVVAEKKPDESSSSSEEEKKSKKEEKEKDGKKDPVRQRSAGSLMVKKTSQEDLRQARRLERAHTISVGIADSNHPINTQPLPDTPSKKAEKSVEEPHEEGAKKKHAATSPRFKSFIKKLSFRAEKKDKVEKKEDKTEASSTAEKDDKKHEKKDKEKKVDHEQKKLEKEKKDEEKRLEKERKELEKKKKKEAEAAEKEAKKHEKKDKKKKDESTPPESKSGEDHKKELKKSTKDKDKKDESSSSESVVKYEYKPVDAHMSVNLPAGSTPEAAAAVATVPAAEVEHKSGEEKKVEVEVKVETETKSVEEKKPEAEVEVETKNRSRSSSSSSSSKSEKAHEPVVEVPTAEVKAEKEPEVHVEAKVEPAHEVKEVAEVTVKEPESPKEGEAKVEVASPKVEVKAEKQGTVSPLALSGEDDKEKEKKKREKEEKARKEKEESAKKKAEKEAKKKEKEEKEREEKERKKAEKESKKKPAEKEKEKEKEKPEKEPKKKDKKAEAGADGEESSSSSDEKEKKGKKSPKWLQKLKPKTARKKEVEKTSPRDEASGDLVLNRKKKAVVVEPANDLESSINSPRPQLTESTSEKSQAPTSNSGSEVKLKLESTEKARAENQTHIEEQTRSVLSSVGSKLDELENQLNTLDLSISPRASATIPAETSPREPDTPASREKLGTELQNLEAMLNDIPEQAEVKKETEVAPVTPVIETSVNVSISAPEHVDEKPKETKDDSSSNPSS